MLYLLTDKVTMSAITLSLTLGVLALPPGAGPGPRHGVLEEHLGARAELGAEQVLGETEHAPGVLLRPSEGGRRCAEERSGRDTSRIAG